MSEVMTPHDAKMAWLISVLLTPSKATQICIKHKATFVVTPNTMQVLRVSKEMYNEAIYGEPAHKQEAIMESASNNCIAIA